MSLFNKEQANAKHCTHCTVHHFPLRIAFKLENVLHNSMLDSYAGHVPKTFCSVFVATFRRICILTLTDLFCHEMRIMLILHSIVVQVVRGCCFFLQHQQHSAWPSIPKKKRKRREEGVFLSFLSQFVSMCNMHWYTLLKFQSKPMFAVHIWTTDMQFIWLRHAGKWPMMMMMRKNCVYFQQIWYAADDTVCILHGHRNRVYVCIVQFNR